MKTQSNTPAAAALNLLICPGLGTFLLKRPAQASLQIALTISATLLLFYTGLLFLKEIKNIKPSPEVYELTQTLKDPDKQKTSQFLTSAEGKRLLMKISEQNPISPKFYILIASSASLLLFTWTWGLLVLFFPKPKL